MKKIPSEFCMNVGAPACVDATPVVLVEHIRTAWYGMITWHCIALIDYSELKQKIRRRGCVVHITYDMLLGCCSFVFSSASIAAAIIAAVQLSHASSYRPSLEDTRFADISWQRPSLDLRQSWATPHRALVI